jgi:hypothetical protein
VPDKETSEPIACFLAAIEAMEEDLPARPVSIRGVISFADARRMGAGSPVPPGEVDLAIFSPPYPNNIDYTEVYKLEAWFLGLIASKGEFSAQRRRTIRSHGSLTWGDSYAYEDSPMSDDMADLLEPLLSAVPVNGRYERSRRQVISGYADDMFVVLKHLYSALRPGGDLVFAVGNSLHGHDGDRFVIASDLVLASIASMVGFEIRRIEVARYPRRRRTPSEFLRESVVFAQKPAESGGCQ